MLRLFEQALELEIPHNVFAAMLNNIPLLQNALTAFTDRYRPLEKRG
ncbi:hypothetical protein ACIQH9_21835 [Pseudarthrobacter oxydans]